MATMNVKDAAGSTIAIEKPNPNGRTGAVSSRPVVLATEDKAALDAVATAIGSATYFPATQPVSGTVGVSGSVAVTGALTETQLRASPLAVDVTFPATQPVSGTVGVSGAVGVTGTFFQATQPISAAALPLPTGAATSAKQDANTAAIAKLGGAKRWFAITPDGNTDLVTIPDAIYVGGAGSLVLKGTDGVNVTFPVTADKIYPFSPTRVLATGTTATGLVGLVS